MTQQKLRSILVATDLSEASDDVLASAADLARQTGAALHVLHAVEPLFDPGFPPDPGVRLAPELLDEARRRLAEQVDHACGPDRPEGTAEVVAGRAWQALRRAARAVEADVVAVGPHTGSDLGTQILGSTADRLIRSSSVPCLVLRGSLRTPLRRLAVPFDFSRPSRRALALALAWAGALADPPGPRLTVVHVAAPAGRPLEPRNREAELTGRIREAVEAARAGAGRPEPPEARIQILWGGKAVEGIVRFAATDGTGLLVAGTHGHGPLRRALIGSVAAGLVLRAPCPVLLVPPDRAGRTRGATEG